MTISPQDAEKLADGLRTTFSNLEGILLERIARRLGSGTASPSWRDDKLAQVQALKNEISELVEQFTKGMDGYIEKGIKKAFEMGKNGADMDIIEAQRQGYDGQAVRNLQTATMTTVAPLNTLAVSALVAEAVGAIDGMKFNILRKSEDAYRQVIARTATSVIAGTETKLQAVQRAINEFADAGITGFVDKAGRNWNIGSYSDMAVRTAVGRAAMAGHELRLGELEHDLVIVSQHPDECPLCRQYEGKIFSLKGTSEKYPPLAVAKAGGLFHCNCGHVATAYFEGFTSPMPEKIGKPTDYEEKQKQRAIERQIRKWKNREAVAITPQERAKAEARRKEWQLAMREFIKDTGRRRKPEREVINFGAKPQPNQFKTIPLKTEIKKPEKKKKPSKPKAEAKPKKQEPPKPPDKSAEERKRDADVAEFKKRIAESDVIEKVGGKAYVDVLVKRFESADENARRLFLTWYSSENINNKGTGARLNFDGTERDAHWLSSEQKIYMNYKNDFIGNDYENNGATFFHEVGHLVDSKSFGEMYSAGAIDYSSNFGVTTFARFYSSQNPKYDKLNKTIIDESNLIINMLEKEYEIKYAEGLEFDWQFEKKMIQRLYERGAYAHKLKTLDELISDKEKQKFIKNKIKENLKNGEVYSFTLQKHHATLADILSGAFKNKYKTKFGHSTKYWKAESANLVLETFAHVFEAEFNPDSKKVLMKYFPKTYEMILDIMKEMI
jgi:hypothetical protein